MLVARAFVPCLHTLVLAERARFPVVPRGADLEVAFGAEPRPAAPRLVKHGVHQHADGTFFPDRVGGLVDAWVPGRQLMPEDETPHSLGVPLTVGV